MQADIHISGMGVLGCFMALELERAGVPFTWSDNENEINAWRACTGAIYPAGSTDSLDMIGYTLWDRKLSGAKKNYPARKFFEYAHYEFNHKSPPHNGVAEFSKPTDTKLARLALPSIHFNAQACIPWVRKRFEKQRLGGGVDSEGSVIIIARNSLYNYAAATTHRYWGWTALVDLKYKKKRGDPRRTAFYFREGRFLMAYAYPCPGTPYWYAGSSIIMQKLGKEKKLAIPPKLTKWQENFERLSRGLVRARVMPDTIMLEGWRPAYKLGQEPRCFVSEGRKIKIFFPALWNSGVRHAPLVISNAMKTLVNHGKVQSDSQHTWA